MSGERYLGVCRCYHRWSGKRKNQEGDMSNATVKSSKETTENNL
jgi:hypothetical protein